MYPASSHSFARLACPALLSLIVTAGSVRADVTFYGIGQLPGAPNSEIRDAVPTPTGILAAGNAQLDPASNFADTAILWTPESGIMPLPSLDDTPVNPNGRFITASQIATGKLVVAARLLIETTGRKPYPALYNQTGALAAVVGLPAGAIWGAANSVSANAGTTYGFWTDPSGNLQGFRWTVADGASPLPIPPGFTSVVPSAKGSTGDGSVDVGSVSTNGSQGGPGSAAFEYTSATNSVALLPQAPGGTWSIANGIEPNGTYIAGSGDSSAYPNGEALLWVSGALSELGVPDAEAPYGVLNNIAGVTRNGAVVVLAGTVGSYLHNAYGWFDLRVALAAGGGDLSGWSALSVLGISADGTLVFGHGTHNGGTEGFVAQVTAGYFEKYGKPGKR